jgi:hypothetical protein
VAQKLSELEHRLVRVRTLTPSEHVGLTRLGGDRLSVAAWRAVPEADI